MDPKSIHRRIEKIREFIQNTEDLINRFPNLKRTTTPTLGLSSLILESIEAKKTFLSELVILNKRIDMISQRIDLPVLVGVMGRYSSGKSALLNAFWREIYPPDEIPEEIKRVESKTAQDFKFTYITHSDYSQRFKKNDNIEIKKTDHDFFHRLNFIDTPGTGWSLFTEEEIIDLLSSSDIILFLFKPTEILDALSVEALNIKYSTYKNIPMWFIITYADSYAERGDFNTIDEAEFANNLEDAKKKLSSKICTTDGENQARENVLKNISFDIGENTFLVDGHYQFRIKELLKKLREEFDSTLVKQKKENQIYDEVQQIHNKLKDVLNQAENHINHISEYLKNSYSSIIIKDVNTLKTTTIISEIKLLTEKLYSRLRLKPLNLDIHHREVNELTSPYYYEPPEFSLLKLHLDELRNEKLNSGFELHLEEIIFPIDTIENQLDLLLYMAFG